jgi:prophage regulatory protein
MNRLLRLPDVKALTGLGRSTIYLKMAKGEFPGAVKLGERAVAWPQADIERWIQDRVAASRPVPAGAGGRPAAAPLP